MANENRYRKCPVLGGHPIERLEERSLPSGFGSPQAWSPSFVGGWGTRLADVNGDGKADAVAYETTGAVSVKPSTGSGFGPSQSWVSTDTHGPSGLVLADVDGDRKADFVRVRDSGVTVRLSTGSGFAPERSWGVQPAQDRRGTDAADVNGDGKADLIFVTTRGVLVHLSTGAGFGNGSNWTGVPYYGGVATAFADVTGDGRADAIVVNSNAVDVRRSTGSSFSGNEDWTRGPYYGQISTQFADVTGDGRADAIVVNTNGIVVRRSTGGGFSGNEVWSSIPFTAQQGLRFVDVTGDRRADAVAVSSGGIAVMAAVTTATTTPAAPAGLAATAASYRQINLSWGNVAGETGYRIERSTGSGWAAVGTTAANVTTFQDVGVAAGTAYQYRVVAVNGAAASAPSNTAAATTPAAPVLPVEVWTTTIGGQTRVNFRVNDPARGSVVGSAVVQGRLRTETVTHNAGLVAWVSDTYRTGGTFDYSTVAYATYDAAQGSFRVGSSTVEGIFSALANRDGLLAWTSATYRSGIFQYDTVAYATYDRARGSWRTGQSTVEGALNTWGNQNGVLSWTSSVYDSFGRLRYRVNEARSYNQSTGGWNSSRVVV